MPIRRIILYGGVLTTLTLGSILGHGVWKTKQYLDSLVREATVKADINRDGVLMVDEVKPLLNILGYDETPLKEAEDSLRRMRGMEDKSPDPYSEGAHFYLDVLDDIFVVSPRREVSVEWCFGTSKPERYKLNLQIEKIKSFLAR